MKAVVEYTDEKYIKKLTSTDKFSAIEELAEFLKARRFALMLKC
jgi:hypothetical protein